MPPKPPVGVADDLLWLRERRAETPRHELVLEARIELAGVPDDEQVHRAIALLLLVRVDVTEVGSR